jgi:hypothetical protein
MVEELLPGFLPGWRHMNKTRRVEESPRSKDEGQTRAKIEKEGEIMTGATKSNIQEKRGAEHLTARHLVSFLG